MLATAASSPLVAQTPPARTPPDPTVAGTAITNVAGVRDAFGNAASSNASTLIVAERLDCALARGDGGDGALVVLLTNPGNGREAYVISASAPASSRPVALDAGGGRFDPALVLAGGVTPLLAPGATLRLLVSRDGASGTAVTVTARAITGSGTPGTVFAGKGDGGGDAVVGPTGAAAQVAVEVAADAPPTIVEAQSVLAADGSAASRRGSVVTYTITCRFAAASRAARVVNPVPANTAYAPGTLTLDDAALPDAGHVSDAGLVVPLGAVAAGELHRITFKAIIQ